MQSPYSVSGYDNQAHTYEYVAASVVGHDQDTAEAKDKNDKKGKKKKEKEQKKDKKENTAQKSDVNSNVTGQLPQGQGQSQVQGQGHVQSQAHSATGQQYGVQQSANYGQQNKPQGQAQGHVQGQSQAYSDIGQQSVVQQSGYYGQQNIAQGQGQQHNYQGQQCQQYPTQYQPLNNQQANARSTGTKYQNMAYGQQGMYSSNVNASGHYSTSAGQYGSSPGQQAGQYWGATAPQQPASRGTSAYNWYNYRYWTQNIQDTI